MINIQASTIIHCPVEKVFAFVANFENLPQWERDFLEVQQETSASSGVGATYNCLLTFPGPTTISQFEITEYVPNHKITYRSEPTRPIVPKGSFLFEPVTGGTKITSMTQPEFHGFAGLMEGIMASSIEKHTVEHLNNLKRLLES